MSWIEDVAGTQLCRPRELSWNHICQRAHLGDKVTSAKIKLLPLTSSTQQTMKTAQRPEESENSTLSSLQGTRKLPSPNAQMLQRRAGEPAAFQEPEQFYPSETVFLIKRGWIWKFSAENKLKLLEMLEIFFENSSYTKSLPKKWHSIYATVFNMRDSLSLSDIWLNAWILNFVNIIKWRKPSRKKR